MFRKNPNPVFRGLAKQVLALCTLIDTVQTAKVGGKKREKGMSDVT